MGRHPSLVAKPPCPRHEGSYVVFDGHYGRPGHRRQRYRCYPSGHSGKDEEFHRFVPPLPRQQTVGGVCVTCERGVHPSEGPQGARKYEFSAREVAEALVEVGRGVTYANAAARIRAKASRFRFDGSGRELYTRHGQLVQDWVEVCAPVVFEEHRRSTWPAEGSLVVDHLGFRVRDFNSAGQPKVGPVAFNVFAAMGYDGGVGRLWALGAYPTATKAEFAHFFSQLDGAPERMVCDGHSGTIGAAQDVWRETDIYRSDWHLKDSLQDYLIQAKLHGNTRIQRALHQAFVNRYLWEHFTVIAYRHRRQAPKLMSWIARYEDIVLDQMRHRPGREERRSNPTTTGGLETKLDPLKAWLAPRTHGFRNRARLDRLLTLMQLAINDQDDADATPAPSTTGSSAATASQRRDASLLTATAPAHSSRPRLRRRARSRGHPRSRSQSRGADDGRLALGARARTGRP